MCTIDQNENAEALCFLLNVSLALPFKRPVEGSYTCTEAGVNLMFYDKVTDQHIDVTYNHEEVRNVFEGSGLKQMMLELHKLVKV